jgi:hypothetical protein
VVELHSECVENVAVHVMFSTIEYATERIRERGVKEELEKWQC